MSDCQKCGKPDAIAVHGPMRVLDRDEYLREFNHTETPWFFKLPPCIRELCPSCLTDCGLIEQISTPMPRKITPVRDDNGFLPVLRLPHIEGRFPEFPDRPLWQDTRAWTEWWGIVSELDAALTDEIGYEVTSV